MRWVWLKESRCGQYLVGVHSNTSLCSAVSSLPQCRHLRRRGSGGGGGGGGGGERGGESVRKEEEEESLSNSLWASWLSLLLTNV